MLVEEVPLAREPPGVGAEPPELVLARVVIGVALIPKAQPAVLPTNSANPPHSPLLLLEVLERESREV